MGHLMQLPDADGSLQFEPLALEYYDMMFPSFALVVVAQSLNLRPEEKDIDKRHQSGSHMVASIRACVSRLAGTKGTTP